MFSNLIIYKIAGAPWRAAADDIAAELAMCEFVDCGPTQERSAGWVSPRGELNGALVEVVAGQYILRLQIETKSVPPVVVKRKAQARADEIEQTTGRKPGKKEMRDLREEALRALLPAAFPKRSSTMVWIDPHAGLLLIDATTARRADEIISLLVKTLEGFVVKELHTATSAAAAMCSWLATQDLPTGFSIDRKCELKATDTSKAVIRYANHALDIDEIRQHIDEGKLPTLLAMTWDERVSFLLTERMQLRKLTFADSVFETVGEKEDRFDADVAIATGEIRRLLPDLIAALDGEIATGETA